jgi:hypothetical protein
MKFRLPLLLSCLFHLPSSARGIPSHSAARDQVPTSYIVHQFPQPTWIENIAVRGNGQLLVTLLLTADLYLIDPVLSVTNPSSNITAKRIHNFAPNKSVLGIAEVQPDHFYIIASNLTISPFVVNPGAAVYSVDLTQYNSLTNEGAVVNEVTALPTAGLLNGMATLDASKGLVIMTDSVQGAIYVLNVHTGEYSILLQEPEMAPPPAGGLGVNGVKVLASNGTDVYIYFDNTNQSLFCRIPFSLSSLQQTGPVEILESGYSADDFTLDPLGGFAYMADGNTNSINRIPLAGGPVTTVLGGANETIVEGPTSVAVGRGKNEFVKYITTDGGSLAPIDGTFKEGGRVVALII